MNRTFDRISHEGPFDVLIVGGGIYGAWSAWHAARRGLKTALIEAADWGSLTSSASSKLVHGGLRYFEHGHFGLVRRALRERSVLHGMAPHLVWPLNFAVPLYADSRVPAWKLGWGLALYDLMAGRGPAPRRGAWPLAEVPHRLSALRRDGLKAILSYGDCQTDDARLVWEVVEGAMAEGAVAVNYSRATELLRKKTGVCGVRVRDEIAGATIDVLARVVLLTTGPMLGQAGIAAPAPVRLTQGVHLSVPTRDPGLRETALLLMAPSDGRVFFVLPWYGMTLIGTTDTDFQGDPHNAAADEDDIAYLLAAVNQFLPGCAWTRADVAASWAGVRCLRFEGGRPSSVSRDWSVWEPEPGMMASVGGKLTSARVDAGRLVLAAEMALGRRPRRVGEGRLPRAPDGSVAEWLVEQSLAGERLGLRPAAALTLARRFGTRVGELHRAIEAEPEGAAPIHPSLPFVRAEIEWVRAHEMVVRDEDIFERRIPVGKLAKRETLTDKRE